jgi:hypothetical protein
LTAIIIIIYLLLVFLVFINERWSDGDEVHYLLVTSSIYNDFDLQLENNYENKDYFYHHSNEERPHKYEGRNGEWRPAGGVITSIILTPAYGLSLAAMKYLGFESNRAFLFFPRMTILIIHIFFSLILIKFLRALGFSKNISLLSVILFLIQLPIVIYAQAIYSDLISAYFLMTGVFGVILFTKVHKYKWLIISSVFLGLNIFVHSKQIVLTTFFIISSFFYLHFKLSERSDLRILKWFKSGYYRKIIYSILLPWLFFLISNAAMKFYWFGKFLFDGIGEKTESRGYLALIENPLKGFLGKWLDIEVGMLWNAPIFILLFIGLFLWYKNKKLSFLLIIPSIFIYIFITSSVEFWDGGFCPPGRQLLISIPILLPGLSWVLHSSKKIIWSRWLVGFLAIISLSLSLLIPFVGRMGLPSSDGYNIYWRTMLKYTKLSFLEPLISLNFFKPGLYEYIVGLGIIIVLILIGYLLERQYSRAIK